MENRVFSKCVAVLLAMSMVFTTGLTSVSHAEEARPVGEIRKIDVPLDDGVYYAQVDLWNASSNQASMGNQALRGSMDYKSRHEEDAEAYDKAIVIVKDKKATALLEYMPMGFIGKYGFLMEFDALNAANYQQWGGIYEGNSHLEIADVLSIHRTTDGKTVYDAYNNPESSEVFNCGEKHKRPACHDYKGGKINISDVPYPHLMAVDCTPIATDRGKGDGMVIPETIDQYSVDNYAYVHVFVPVMFTIMPTSGDQDARIKVDWKGAQKIDNPENILEYRLYQARQIEKGIYTGESYNNLQDAIASVSEKMNNVWPAQNVTLNGSGSQAQPKAELHNFTAEEEAAMVKELDDAEKALKITGADYSKVNDAVKNVPKDLSRYTDETAKAVKKAVDAVDYNLTVNDQEKVNEMAEKINAAIKALELKPETVKPSEPEKPEVTDPLKLKDGTYLVKGEMVKTDRVSPSMSDGAINHNIKLTVKDGKYYATLDFDGVTYLGKHGYLGTLKYFKSGFTLDKYGKPAGNLENVKVESYQLDKNGKRLKDEYGTDYPDLVTFELVKEALSDGYAPLQVFVPVMESISEGTGTQAVYLKLDWSTVEKTNADDKRFEPEEKTETPAVNAADKNTGIRVNAPANTFKEKVELVVNTIKAGSKEYKNAEKALEKTGKKFKLFELHFENAAGTEIQPDGKVTVKYPIPEGYDKDKIAVYRINDNGTKTKMVGAVKGGFIEITQNHFSYYAIVEEGSTITDAENTAIVNGNAPKTGDTAAMMPWMLLALAAGSAAIALKRKED